MAHVAHDTCETSSSTEPGWWKHPKKWGLWKQTWANYIILAKLADQTEEAYQKAMFLVAIGQEAL